MLQSNPIKLSDKFSYVRLIQFAMPSILMMVIISIYGVVDGIIVSNFTDVEHFAALNLILPYITLLGSAGLMLGTGGSALVGKILGKGQHQRASETFSLLTYFTAFLGVCLGLFGLLTSNEVAYFMGANEGMQQMSYEYSKVLFIFFPFYILQVYFQSFLTTAERPWLGLWITFFAGAANVVLDFVFVVNLEWGLFGAGLATGICQMLGGILPILYFLHNRKYSKLNIRLGKCVWSRFAIWK